MTTKNTTQPTRGELSFDGCGIKAVSNPRAHFTLHEDGQMSVFFNGQPLCRPTSFESARIVAIKMGLGAFLPTWDATVGEFKPCTAKAA
jgi:hypothetical protein